MPKIRLHRREKAPKVEIEEAPTKRERSLSFRKGSVASTRTEFTAAERTKTLNSLMTVQKNPSTIFKPPFGTNMEEHHSMLGEHAKSLWEYNKITDVTVKLRGTPYPCHKTVLSCYSKYFKELLLETKTAVKEINLRLTSVTNVAFEVLLTYMYTSKLNLSCQNIGEVYTGARKLGIDGALVLCTRVLTGKTKYNVHSVYLYVTAKKQRLEDCAAKALKTMTRRFEEIVGTPEFLDLEFPQVLEYLSQDVLAARSEVIVYLAALKWLSVKYLDREQHATDLISCVRFQMMTLNEVLACFSPPLLPGILELKRIRESMLAATCYVAAMTVNEEKRFRRYACRPRRYLLPRENIILWDTNIYDSDRHAQYVEQMAAMTIQAAFRGYKTRKSIEADKEAGLLKGPDIDIDPFEKSLARLDVFEPPKDEEDEADINKAESRIASGSTFSFMDNIRKSIVSFMGGTDEDEDEKKHFEVTQLKKKYEQSKKAQEDSPNEAEDGSSNESQEMMPWKQGKAVRRSSSVDTLVGQINKFAEDTELKKYTSDTAVDISSEAIQKNALEKPENTHRLYSRASEVDSKEERNLRGSFSSASDETQSNENEKGLIIVTGGFRSDAEDDELEGKQMFVFNCQKRRWKRFGTMEKARHHHCLVFLNGEIYFIGGCNPENTKEGRMVAERTCYKLEISSMTWSRIAKMRHCRMYHGVAELNGKIYAVGGKDDKNRMLSSVEVYDPALNKWSDLNSPLEIPTMGIGMCSHQGKLWVAGGMVQDASGNIIMIKEVKCYEPEKKRWSQNIKPLPLPRAFSTAVSFENQLFVIGGTSQSQELKGQESMTSVSDVFCYNSKEKRWEPTTFLPYPRHFVETAVLGNCLYVLGGLTSYQRTAPNDVLMYGMKNRKWNSVSVLPQPLCGFAAITVPHTAF